VGTGPAGYVERAFGMSIVRGGMRGVMRTKDVLNQALVYVVVNLNPLFGIDEKALITDWATDAARDLRLLTYVHGNLLSPRALFRGPGHLNYPGDRAGTP